MRASFFCTCFFAEHACCSVISKAVFSVKLNLCLCFVSYLYHSYLHESRWGGGKPGLPAVFFAIILPPSYEVRGKVMLLVCSLERQGYPLASGLTSFWGQRYSQPLVQGFFWGRLLILSLILSKVLSRFCQRDGGGGRGMGRVGVPNSPITGPVQSPVPSPPARAEDTTPLPPSTPRDRKMSMPRAVSIL